MGIPELVWENGSGGAHLGDAPRRGGFDVLELGRGPGVAPARPGRKLGQDGPTIPTVETRFDLAGGLMGLLSDGISGLATIIGAPLGVVGDAASFVIDGIAGLVGKVPVVGELVGTVLLVGKTLLNAGLRLPETVLKAFANVLGSFSKLSPDQQKKVSEAAVSKVTEWGRERGREEDVKAMLERNAPVAGGASSANGGGLPGWATAAIATAAAGVAAGGVALLA
jgi:hypothetical protein